DEEAAQNLKQKDYYRYAEKMAEKLKRKNDKSHRRVQRKS
ncbi:unnamed protein product, partial [marine sediment metagenome]